MVMRVTARGSVRTRLYERYVQIDSTSFVEGGNKAQLVIENE